MIGKTLLHYTIIEKLGEGGMGEVYRARDTKLGRDVAIKILPEDMYRDPERRKRFAREARVIAALNHPNIVTIHSVEEFEDRPFLTMELVKGKTLRDSITEQGMSLGVFFSVAVPLVDAVCSAHAQGITHRDLKPANVMLNDEGRLKVLDFGLAKLFQESTGPEDDRTVGADVDTQAGRILGTVSYMSPEQVEGKPLDGRSDIFSLGIVFYEMLTGRRPFAGDSNASTISSILRDNPPSVTEIKETLPRHLGRIVRRCLAKDPDRRYQSALDLRNDLQELADEVDSGDVEVDGSAITSGTGSRLAPDSSIQRPITSDSIVLPGTKRTYRWILGVVGLIVVAAIAVTFVRTRSGGGPESVTSALNEDATLGVIGFENLSDPEDSENLGRVLMGLVTTGLAESGGLNVASTAKVLAARREVGAGDREFDASLAADAARHAGADVMLVGQVIRDGERMILTAELVDVSSGNTLGSLKKEAASSSELFELASAIAHDVRGLMGVTKKGETVGEDVDLAASLTDSPEAYRQFTAGQVAIQQGRYDQAADRLNQAIRIDSTFALAYMQLLMAYTWNGETNKGLAALELGLPYVSRLPERWQIVYQANLDYYGGNVDAAYDAVNRLVESSTDLPDAYNLLGEIMTHHTKYENSRRARECFERALEIDPTFEVVFFHLVDCYIDADDVEALQDLIQRYRQRDPSDPRVVSAELALMGAQQKYDQVIARIEDQIREGDLTHWIELAACLGRVGDWERAYQLCDDAVNRREKGYNQAFALEARGAAQVGRGNIKAGMVDLGAASDKLMGLGQSGSWAKSIVRTWRICESRLLMDTGDLDEAVATAEKAVAVDPRSTWAHRALAECQLRGGRVAEAEKTFRDLKTVQSGNHNPGDEFDALMMESELEAARGNRGAALAALRKAGELPVELRDPLELWETEGDIRSAVGDTEGAVVAYRRIFKPDLTLLPGNQLRSANLPIPAHYKLARLEEELGRLTEAKRHYEAYLERWGNADIAIPNVKDARERLERLEQM